MTLSCLLRGRRASFDVVPSGFEFTFQYWQPDPFGPQGWAATNAVKLTAP